MQLQVTLVGRKVLPLVIQNERSEVWDPGIISKNQMGYASNFFYIL